ncbi:MAG: endolytic transglycosylase MltG [Oscillatoriales cyanobacterium SM2_1_8]|nr:endolytic transglycosylase MltG [Oscillatoriales cyanobacterium SM2_1_8]
MSSGMKTKRNRWRSVATVGLGAIAATWSGGLWWRQVSAAPHQGQDGDPPVLRFAVPTGAPLSAIARELEAAGAIRSALALRLWLEWQNRMAGQPKVLQAGTYDLSLGWSLAEVVAAMQRSRSSEVRVTIPEGWNLQDIGQRLAAQGGFSNEAFQAAARNPQTWQTYTWLPPDLTSLEGYLFPDTYQLPAGNLTPEAAIGILLRRFEEVGLPMYQTYRQRTADPLSLHEWVTLASIVEKESVLDSERRTIAGVFTERLQRGMRLEADPTVEYALGVRQTKEQPLTLAQVRTESPYNTYLVAGLPPGPIAAPGKASLAATSDPEPTEYLYFMARYDGSHIFSRTLAEHERAIAQVEAQLQNRN